MERIAKQKKKKRLLLLEKKNVSICNTSGKKQKTIAVQTQQRAQQVKPVKNVHFPLQRANEREFRTIRGPRWRTPSRGGLCTSHGRHCSAPGLTRHCCKRRERVSITCTFKETQYTKMPWTADHRHNGLPLTVRVAGRLVRVLQGEAGGDEAAAGALDGVGHRVPGLAPGTPLHPGDAELRLEEQVQAAVRQQQGRLEHTAGQKNNN